MDPFLVSDDRYERKQRVLRTETMTGISICHLLVLATAFIILLIFYLNYDGVQKGRLGTCDDGRVASTDCVGNASVCQVGYLIASQGDTCVQELAALGTPCASPCYVTDAATTTCTGTGDCVGNTTECRGHCETDLDCNTTIPFDVNWLAARSYYEDTDERIVWSYRNVCYFNRCELFVVDRFIQQEVSDYPTTIAYSQCSEYLESDFLASGRASCLTTERYLLDTNLTKPSNYLNDPYHPPQFSMCLYYYNCADLNQTAMEITSMEATTGSPFLFSAAQLLSTQGTSAALRMLEFIHRNVTVTNLLN